MKLTTKEIVLVIIILLIGLFMLSMFVIRPAIVKHNNNLRMEGLEYAIITIMQQATSCQPVPLTYKDTTIEIVAVDCLRPSE